MREQATSTEENTVPTKNQGSRIERIVSQHFTILLIVLSLCGGVTAMLLPWALQISGSTGQVDSNLRLHILYVTGGIIAVLGLVETHRKNTVDREKAGVEKENYEKMQAHQASVLEEQQRQFNVTMNQEREKVEADKAKNEQDHIRQVHAERRSRYTTAIEQLSSNKASIRLGGVYTLVGLVDEWLSDEKAIHNIEERRKEGQVIINNLCAYIRSPFDLASKHKELSKDQAPENYEGGTEQFNEDQAKFRGEKELRTTILDAIRTRLNGGTIIQEGETKKFLKGPWSDFDYDFSNAHFFYSTNFARNRFGALSNFSRATFAQSADFSRATFAQSANFFRATFTGNASFYGTKFTQSANFIGEVFTPSANFIGAAFAQSADFSRATFEDKPKFVYALDNKTYKARFSHKAKPKNYRFKVSYYSPYKIEIREQEHNGVKFIIPKDAELFDPDKPSE